MGNVFRVINSNGDIEITMYRKANAVFKTNEYNETDNICTYKEIINIFDLLKENQELKSQLKGTTHCFDEEEHEKLKKQQKEFIEWLEDEIKRINPEHDTDEVYRVYGYKVMLNYILLIKILNKYKEIIGGNNDN